MRWTDFDCDAFTRHPELRDESIKHLTPEQIERYRVVQEREGRATVEYGVPHEGSSMDDVSKFFNFSSKLMDLLSEEE